MKNALLFVFILACCVLWGCGERPLSGGVGGATPGATTWTTLISLGHTLIWAGGIIGTLGLAFRVAAIFYPLLAPIAWITGLAAEVGGVSVLCGIALSWIGDNPWIIAITVGTTLIAAVAWIWMHRAIVRRWVCARENALHKALTK